LFKGSELGLFVAVATIQARLKSNSFIQQTEPAKDTMRMKKAVKLLSTEFSRVCALRVVDDVVVDGMTMGWRLLEEWPCWGRR
jgi:hypothetical protein